MSFLSDGTVGELLDPLDFSGGKAAGEQTEIARRAAEQSTAESRRQFDIGQEILEPFAQEAVPALGLQAKLAGAQGPQAQAESFQQFEESPATQFLRNAGLKASLPGVQNPEVANALVDFSKGLATQDFGNQFNRIGSVAGTGQTSQMDLVGLGDRFTSDIVSQQQDAFKSQQAGLAAQRSANMGLAETGLGIAASLGGGN